jgi:RNA polymerase sigma-70 factor, ECF subfamily
MPQALQYLPFPAGEPGRRRPKGKKQGRSHNATLGEKKMSVNSCGNSDGDLLIVVATGDRRALQELYLGYHPRLARFLLRFTQRHENIEEIINDTFLVVWQNAAAFRSDSQVSTWIFGIAYRTALKSIRRQRNHTAARNLGEYPEQAVDPVRDTEVRDWVVRGLDRLPIEQRLTVELSYNMGHSLQEIAEITGAPVGTVKTRMFHARRKLRHYLPALGGSVSEMSASIE